MLLGGSRPHVVFRRAHATTDDRPWNSLDTCFSAFTASTLCLSSISRRFGLEVLLRLVAFPEITAVLEETLVVGFCALTFMVALSLE